MSNDHQEIHNRLDLLESKLTNSLDKLTSAVNKLVEVETEHKATKETLARYGAKLDTHDTRIDNVEKKIPTYDGLVSAAWWGLKIVGALMLTGMVGTTVMYMAG